MAEVRCVDSVILWDYKTTYGTSLINSDTTKKSYIYKRKSVKMAQ